MSAHQSNPTGFMDQLQRRLVTLWLLLTCVSLICLVTLTSIWYIWNDREKNNIRSTEAAGRVVSVAQSVGLFTRALVETDQGFFSLTEGASLFKGEELSLQARGNGVRFLCNSNQHCLLLNETRHKSRP